MCAIFRDTADTDLSDQTAKDRRRHLEKVKQSIRDNIGEIIAEESIIGQNKDKLIKVPIKTIKEFRFIFGDNSNRVAQGNGKQSVGDVFESSPETKDSIGPAGDQPGIDALETEITLEELIDIMFDDLQLPDLEKKKLKKIISKSGLKRKGHRKQGIRPRLDKRLSAKNRVKRKIASKSSEADFPFHERDLRYFFVKPKPKESVNAVTICIMDTSGSMTTTKKYLARSFYFLLYNFIRSKYENSEIVFIAHHTEAKEVSELEFFHRVESGGTYISSGYEKAIEIIFSRYHPSSWNIYVFHCSDGDNYYSDNERAVQLAEELCKYCNLFGYGEIKPHGSSYYSGTMLDIYSRINRSNFHTVLIQTKEDIYPALRDFLSREK